MAMRKICVDFEKIDWALLHSQKEWLTTQDSEEAYGLIHFIDFIQDTAVESGYFTEREVFGFEVADYFKSV